MSLFSGESSLQLVFLSSEPFGLSEPWSGTRSPHSRVWYCRIILWQVKFATRINISSIVLLSSISPLANTQCRIWLWYQRVRENVRLCDVHNRNDRTPQRRRFAIQASGAVRIQASNMSQPGWAWRRYPAARPFPFGSLEWDLARLFFPVSGFSILDTMNYADELLEGFTGSQKRFPRRESIQLFQCLPGIHSF